MSGLHLVEDDLDGMEEALAREILAGLELILRRHAEFEVWLKEVDRDG